MVVAKQVARARKTCRQLRGWVGGCGWVGDLLPCSCSRGGGGGGWWWQSRWPGPERRVGSWWSCSCSRGCGADRRRGKGKPRGRNWRDWVEEEEEEEEEVSGWVVEMSYVCTG